MSINISTIHVTIQYPAHLNQQYGPRCASDTLTDTHEQYIFNTARQVVSLFLSTYQASLMYSTSTGNTWFSHYDPGIMLHQKSSHHQPGDSHNITATQYDHKAHPITEIIPVYTEHDLTLYKETTALCQVESITYPLSLVKFGFVICLIGLIFHLLHFIFVYIVYHI